MTTPVARLQIMELVWEVLPRASYSPHLSPSDYYLFRSMQRLFCKQYQQVEDMDNLLEDIVALKLELFFMVSVDILSRKIDV